MGGKAGTKAPEARSGAKPAAPARRGETSAAASRRNGMRGGRPKKHHYEEVFADLTLPPEADPLAVALWAARIAGTLAVETLQGRGNLALNADIRATLTLIIRALPTERLAAVEKQLDRASKARRKPAVNRGPEVEDVTARPAGASSGDFIRR